jgi:hypothetical protein
VCTFRVAIKNFKVKVNVQKGAVRFRGKKNDNIYLLVSSNLGYYSFLSYDDSPQWLPSTFLLGFAFGFHDLQTRGSWSAHGLCWDLLFGLWLGYDCSCLCLFDANVEVHAMDEKTFNDFLIEKWRWISSIIKASSIHSSYFVYVVEAFTTLHYKA